MKNKEQIDKIPFMEYPFELLKPSCEEAVQNWYKARRYVLDLINDALQKSQSLPCDWHFVIKGDNDLMLSVVRHLALYAHFISYEEYDRYGKLSCKNRTVISIVTKKNAKVIKAELQKPEYLYNLPKHCKMTIFGQAENDNSYIDIAINVVKDLSGVSTNPSILPVINEEIVLKHIESTQQEISPIDTLKALCTNEVYNLGIDVSNLPYEDINSARRYSNALNTFEKKILSIDDNEHLIKEDWENDNYALTSGISNILCADCFEIREKELKILTQKKELDTSDWEKYIKELARCEHNRWVVEKLILGYEPLGKEEIFRYEHLFGEDRTEYWKSLKKRAVPPKHIDLCSNRDLRRIDPDNMKFDTVLMLAIPHILRFVRSKS